MSVEILRRAAKVLREHAEGATPGPWEHVDHSDPSGQPMTKEGLPSTFMGCGSVITLGEGVAGGDIAAPNGDLYPRSGYSPLEDMRYIALMHPPVALALADLLDREAGGYRTEQDTPECPNCGEGCGGHDKRDYHELCGDDAPCACIARPLAVARAILREPEATT